MESVAQKFYMPGDYQSGFDYPKLDSGQRNGLAPLFQEQKLAKEEPYDPSNIIALNENRNQKNVTVRLLNCVIPVGLEDPSGLGIDTPALLRIRT